LYDAGYARCGALRQRSAGQQNEEAKTEETFERHWFTPEELKKDQDYAPPQRDYPLPSQDPIYQMGVGWRKQQTYIKPCSVQFDNLMPG
jgi:hypothetical protein